MRVRGDGKAGQIDTNPAASAAPGHVKDRAVLKVRVDEIDAWVNEGNPNTHEGNEEIPEWNQKYGGATS